MDDANSIALEQYAYWRDLGLSHEGMLQQLGIRLPWRGYLSSDETRRIIAEAWLALQQRRVA